MLAAVAAVRGRGGCRLGRGGVSGGGAVDAVVEPRAGLARAAGAVFGWVQVDGGRAWCGCG